MVKIKCFIDSREQKRINAGKQYFSKYNPYVVEMVYGDYAFTDNDIRVVFEYKTIDDYINSMEDNRVFNQALNQSNVFDYHFVIVVGSEADYEKAISKHGYHSGHYIGENQINGSIASLVEFTSILFPKTEKSAFDLMERIALKCLRDEPIIHRYPKSKGSPAYRFLVNNVGGIGSKTAKNICDDLGLWSVGDVLVLSVEDLSSVKGIGKVKARNIFGQIMIKYS